MGSYMELFEVLKLSRKQESVMDGQTAAITISLNAVAGGIKRDQTNT
jgi:hypothetical protein